MSDKILTILVPTYNRVIELQKLLDNFLLRKPDADIEILLAINASSDGSYAIAKVYAEKIPNLKIIFFEKFVTSAEENINRSIACCNGKYIFILGDDDNLVFGVFALLVKILRNDKTDIAALIFNNITSANILFNFDEIIEKKSYICLQEFDKSAKKIWQSDYADLLKDLGVITVMAFISRYVIRKDLLKDFISYINISRIYSHVFAFLDFLHQKKVTVIDLPLTIRGDSVVTKRFSEMSQANSCATYFHWHYGLLMHIHNAVKKGLISDSWFFSVQEHREDKSKFFLWQNVLNMMLNQQLEYLHHLDEKQKLHPQCLEIFAKLNNSNLKSAERKVCDYILSELRFFIAEASLLTGCKKQRKFLKWRVLRMFELLNNNHKTATKSTDFTINKGIFKEIFSKKIFKGVFKGIFKGIFKKNFSGEIFFNLEKLLYFNLIKITRLKIFPQTGSQGLLFAMKRQLKKAEYKLFLSKEI
jgi:hypothetical protein